MAATRWPPPTRVILLVIVVNVALLGSSLQLGAVFGDSAIVAGRFSGVNNVMFAQVMVAAIALAAIIVTTGAGPARSRRHGRAPRR